MDEKPRPEPLPLADLLAVLRARGLPIGMREHLAVARLLGQWDDTDIGSLRHALAAVLARNPQEVQLVRETFDQLYCYPEDDWDRESLQRAEAAVQAQRPEEAEADPQPRPQPDAPAVQEPRRNFELWAWLRQRARMRWVAWLAAAVLLIALGYVARSFSQPAETPPPQEIPSRPDAPPVLETDPQEPVIDQTRPVPDRELALAAAAALAAALFNWLYVVRTGQQAGRQARRLWADELDALPGPPDYDLALAALLKRPFSRVLLDGLARMLGRHSTTARGELDVERTLERMFRIGLGGIVFRPRVLPHPLLVLEEVGGEMEPFQHPLKALLAGLEARGVLMDRWRFDAEADRLFRASGKAGPPLQRLDRLHPDSPLLVIGTGQGLRRRGETRALWSKMLRRRPRRAWLHPAADLRYWRPELKDLPIEVWPMNPAGLSAMARYLARGSRPKARERIFTDRVVPLDVDRLRWLLSLAPRRDPELAELLRQEFCPEVPSAALAEALAAPPPSAPPLVGPPAEEVHAFLWKVLESSRPPKGSAGYERWRLDRALQTLRIPGGEHQRLATAELRDLANGPMALEVEHALRSSGIAGTLPAPVLRQLRAKVLRLLRRRATRRVIATGGAELRTLLRRSLPTAGELAAAVVFALALFVALPRLGAFQNEVPVTLQWTYLLTVEDPDGVGPFTLRLQRREGFGRERAPDRVELFRGGEPWGREIRLDPNGRAARTLAEDDRGSWYHVQAEVEDHALAVSNKELVGRRGATGWLRITAVDERDQPVSGVSLELKGAESYAAELSGPVTMALPTGDWTLQASAPGFETAQQRITVVAGDERSPMPVRIDLRRIQAPPPTSTPAPATPPRVEPEPSPVPSPPSGATPAEPEATPGSAAAGTGSQPVVTDRSGAPSGEPVESLPSQAGETTTTLPPVERTPEPRSGPAQAAASPWTPEAIREALLVVRRKFPYEAWRMGDIPADDLAAASKGAQVPAGERVIALIRNSAEKRASFVFGEKGIYYHHPREDTGFIPYEDFVQKRSQKTESWTVGLGNDEEFVIAGTGIDAYNFSYILNALRDELIELKKRAEQR